MEFLFIVLAIVILLSVLNPKKKGKFRSPWKRPENDNVIPPTQSRNIPLSTAYDNKNQLSITLKNKYEKKRLLNKTEEEI